MFKRDGVRVPRPTTRKTKTTRYLRPHRTNLLRALDKSLRLSDAGYTIGIKCEWTYIRLHLPKGVVVVTGNLKSLQIFSDRLS
jgi:hypothetical protein